MGSSHFNSPHPGLIRISPIPCFQTLNSSPAKPLWLPVPVFSMQPYLGRALSLMTASPWRLSWSSVAKKWWRESGALPPSSTWGRQERRMEGCRDRGGLRWPASTSSTSVGGGSLHVRKAPAAKARKSFQPLLKMHLDTSALWRFSKWHFIWWWIWW